MALVVLTGGARSGKSNAAQRLAQQRAADGARVVVVAFGRLTSGDAEFAERIQRHRSGRPAVFATLEATDSVSWTAQVADDALLVVDCLGTLLGLAMEEAWTSSAEKSDTPLRDAPADVLPPQFEPAAVERFEASLDWLLARNADTIVVTNEVGDGVVPDYVTGRLFRDLLGKANRTLVDAADSGYLCVAGRLLDLSLLPREARWPCD